MHVWPFLLSVLRTCLALFTEQVQCRFGPVYGECSVHVSPGLLSVLSACLALFTESAQYMLGPVY